MTRRTVLLVSGNGPPVFDGVGHYTARLAAHLAAARPNWRWVWLRRKKRWFSSPLSRAGQVTVVQPWHTWGRPGLHLAEAVVRGLQPDLIHIQEQTHSFHESAAAVRVAAVAPGPVVTTVHEVHPELAGCQWTRELVRLSDVVLVCDTWTGSKCEKHFGRVPDRVLWSPTNIFPPPPEWNVRRCPELVLTFGFINSVKGLAELFAGLTETRIRVPGLRWRIVGPFDPARDPHHAALASCLKADWVKFTGSRTDLDDKELRTWIGEASIMALPFADGATGRRASLQTAWAFGLPLITTIPPQGEADVRPGENCLAVRLDKVDEWADAATTILTDQAVADRLAAGSRAAGDHFGWARLTQAHLELYDTLLEGGGA